MRILAISLTVGLVFAFFYCSFIVIFDRSWAQIFDHEHYSNILAALQNDQWMMLALLTPLMSGIVSAAWTGFTDKKNNNIVAAGILTGITYGIFFPLIAMAGSFLNLSPMLRDITIPLVFMLSAIYFIIVMLGVALYAVLTVSLKKMNSKVPGVKVVACVVAVFLLILILAPPVASYMGVSLGMVERYPHDGPDLVFNVSRINNDTLAITYEGGYGDYVVNDNDHFEVMLNDKNATDMVAAEASKLNISITPAEGLACKKGASATYSGAEITGRTHIFIVYYDNAGWRTVLMDYYIGD